MAVTTVDMFFEVLEKSGLLTPEQIDEVREATGSDDPKAAARWLVKQGRLSRWQAGVLLTGRHQLRMGKYTLLERISSGGLGDVYLAKHQQMGRRVALKTLSRWYTKNPAATKKFLAEIREIAKLDHRNVIHIYDIDNHGDRYYLVMEHVEGEDLQAVVEQKKRLRSEQVAEYLRQAADGLVHAHEHGILHRNLKPANLLVDSQGCVKILNMGMARLLESDLQADQSAIGKGRFAAPEQATGDNVDERADLYSLGVTGLYLLTGKMPSAADKTVASKLEKIFRKMMAADPAKRIQTASEAALLLEKWLAHNARKPAAAAPPEPKAGGKPPLRKKPKLKVAQSLAEPDPIVELEPSAEDTIPVAEEADARPTPPPPKQSKTAAEKTTDVLDLALELEADTTPAVSDFPGIVIDTNAAPLEAAPVELSAAEPATEGEARRKISLPLLLGIGGGAVALIAVVLVLVLFVFNNPDTADGDPSAEQVAATDGAGQKPSDDEFDPENYDPEKDPNRKTNPENGNANNGEPEVPVDIKPDEGEPNTMPPVDEKPVDVPKPDDKPGGEENGNKPPDNGGNDPKPSPDPDPKKPPENDPKDPPEVKPPVEKKDPPKKPQNPFAGLAKVVDLPSLPGDAQPAEEFKKPVVLGPLPLDPADIFGMQLSGGENALKGEQKFSMRRARGGTAELDFEVYYTGSAGARGSELMIAKVWIEEGQLQFQWTDKATVDSLINHLRNCLLSMHTGTATHTLALRKPAAIEPLVLNLDKGDSTVNGSFDWAPDSASVRVEITKLEGAFPKHKYDPSQDLDATRGSTDILFGEENQQALVLKIDSSMGRTVQVKGSLLVNYPGQKAPSRYSKKKVDQILAQANGQTKQIEVWLAQWEGIKDKPQKDRLKPQADAVAREKSQLLAGIAVYEKMLAFIEAMNGGKVHLRVYYLIEEDGGFYQVDLAKSEP